MTLFDHITQIVTSQRFQSHTDTNAFLANNETTEYNLDAINTIPISLIVADNDEVCTTAQAADLAPKLKTLVNDKYVTVVGDHEYFY